MGKSLIEPFKLLFVAIKEHWQLYVGLFLGLIIGLLVGIGFVDWKSLVDEQLKVKVTDWLSSLSTMFAMIFTGGLLIITARAAKSWKEQKTPDLKSVISRNIIDFDTHAVLLTARYFESLYEIIEYNSILLKRCWDIEHSLSALYMFDRSNKKEIDNLFSQLLEIINRVTVLLEKYRNNNNQPNLIQRNSLIKHIDLQYKELFPITRKMFTLVIGKSNVVCQEQDGSS
ncbi:hypothetical protein BKK49_09065 [Rodentibacter rarus]|uniref:hypothetical protein n=1 Tax=Rodentibacter rarus TaxID=1908260 RepID=UPI0009856A55|nr:hypothetical protein [Rodentibacter rarus]OOF38843.1 hypothetical protein BKK49_09065 [Rodentibacter rarus]